MASVLSYNGISLEVQKQVSWTRESIYDGPTFLYQRHVLHVRCIYNPQATSYQSPTTQVFGRLAPQTDNAIRQTLMTPQQDLLYMIGNVIALQSPDINPNTGDPYLTDANIGPFPLHCDVVEVVGIKTYIVEFIIQTDINECTSENIVLSNRWEMTHDINEDFLTVRTIRGHAILRTDIMLAENQVPDDFRAAFFFPVDFNMQREHIHVVATEDGNEVDYEVTDTERFFNLLGYPAGLTRVEAFHTAEIGQPGVDDFILRLGGVAARGLGRAGNIAGRLEGHAGLGNTGTNAVGVAWGLGLSIAGSVIEFGLTLAQLVPRQVHTVVARVWGNRNSTRVQLQTFALGIVMARVLNRIPLATCWFQVTHDLIGKYCECTLRVKQSVVDVLFNDAQMPPMINGVPTANVFQLNTNIMPIQETIPGHTTSNAATNPAPPASTSGAGIPLTSRGSRGTYLGQLVAQVIQDACGLPATPKNTDTPTAALTQPIA